jgi:hypothetical protein
VPKNALVEMAAARPSPERDPTVADEWAAALG